MIEPPMTNPAEYVNRIKFILIEAAIIGVVLVVFSKYWAALGVALGAAISVANFILVSKASALNSMMKRYLLRLLIAGAAIVLCALIDTGMVLGALVGLTMEMQTYLWDAAKELWSIKPGR